MNSSYRIINSPDEGQNNGVGIGFSGEEQFNKEKKEGSR